MAANPIARPVSAEEFIRLYGTEEDNYELIDGEVFEREVSGYSHDMVKNNLKELFDRADIASHGFKCWLEHSFQVSGAAVMTPDVVIMRTERLMNRSGNAVTVGPPEIAFEVAITDKPTVLQRKVSSYLRNGAHAVCCVYPDSKTIVVYTDHEWRELDPSHVLEFPALLPGISIPVAAVFELV